MSPENGVDSGVESSGSSHSRRVQRGRLQHQPQIRLTGRHHLAVMLPPGWSAFDPTIVAELRRSSREADAPCPYRGHDHRIPWSAGGYAKGTVLHGRPPVSFRVSPTYVLEDHLDNFIIGREMVDKLSGKAETWRLGNENSEDALSFNVFRSLQEAGRLSAAASLLTGLELDGEPELIVWGHRLGQTTVEPVAELKTTLDQLEHTGGQQTEPDIILRIPSWGWIFVEAKLGSPPSTYKGRPDKLEGWKKRYAKPDLFNGAKLMAVDPERFPEQLLRNVAVAHAVARGEHVAVVALVRQTYAEAVANWADDYLADKSVITRSATWEQIYALTEDVQELSDLRDYLADKSVNLRKAFEIRPTEP
jgi:hypothetical protein